MVNTTLFLLTLSCIFWLWLLAMVSPKISQAREWWNAALIVGGLIATVILLYRAFATATDKPGGWRRRQ